MRLSTGTEITVALIKPRGPQVEYRAVVAFDDGNHIVVRAPWAEESARELGFVRFEPGDLFTEHYWRDRWYSVKEVRAPRDTLKGWYCDVARPVRVSADGLVSEDLDLDLWVAADLATILRLDEDDFTSSGLSETDPHAAAEARAALDELELLARDGFRAIPSGRDQPASWRRSSSLTSRASARPAVAFITCPTRNP